MIEIHLFRYNIHDGDQFHVDLKPDPPKSQHSNRTGRTSIEILQKKSFFFLLVVDTTRPVRKKSTDNSTNSSVSSTSSDDDKIPQPFSFDSLQKLSNQTDKNLPQTFTHLDQFYPSIDSSNPPPIENNLNDDDDDNDLLLAAAVACTQMKKD